MSRFWSWQQAWSALGAAADSVRVLGAVSADEPNPLRMLVPPDLWSLAGGILFVWPRSMLALPWLLVVGAMAAELRMRRAMSRPTRDVETDPPARIWTLEWSPRRPRAAMRVLLRMDVPPSLQSLPDSARTSAICAVVLSRLGAAPCSLETPRRSRKPRPAARDSATEVPAKLSRRRHGPRSSPERQCHIASRSQRARHNHGVNTRQTGSSSDAGHRKAFCDHGRRRPYCDLVSPHERYNVTLALALSPLAAGVCTAVTCRCHCRLKIAQKCRPKLHTRDAS